MRISDWSSDVSSSDLASIFGPLPPRADGRKTLVGLTRDELAAELALLGEPAFRAKQLWRWIYNAGATDFARMTDLGKGLRAQLEASYDVERPEETRRQHSFDGTAKWLLKMADAQQIETEIGRAHER